MIGAALLMIGLGAVGGCSRQGRVIELGTFGGPSSQARSVNDSGQVVGVAYLTEDVRHAFLYDSGKMYDLGTLGGKNSVALAINDAGQIAGYANIKDGHEQAFVYEGVPGHGGQMVDLGVTTGHWSSSAYALNDAGQIVGAATTKHSRPWDQAFLYDGLPGKGGHKTELGTLGGSVSYAYAINERGQIVGQSTTVPPVMNVQFVYHAFLYDGIAGEGGRIYDLGMLPGGKSSCAYGINALGQIVGESQVYGKRHHGFLYEGIPGLGGMMTDLGTLPGERRSEAYAINDAGFIVGTGDSHGILWRPDGSAVDLHKWLAGVNPKAAAHWKLRFPRSINNKGIIVGYDENYDAKSHKVTYRAFILDASGLVSGRKK
jgi:probable HAF family extracellular repeat protein